MGKHTLLVEGPSDILYLQCWSSALGKRKRTKLDPKWTICPAGGLDKIQSFVALFAGAKLDIAALTDFAKGDKRKIEAILRNKVLESDRLLTFASLLGTEEADVEDIFDPGLYASIVNKALGITGANKLTAAKIVAAEPNTTRLVKKVEACCRLLPPEVPEFDHFAPADWLLRNPATFDGDSQDVLDTLDRAEKVISALNGLLS